MDPALRFLLASVAATLAPILGLPSAAPHALDRTMGSPAKPRRWRLHVQYGRGGGAYLGPCLGAAPLCSSTWLFIEAIKNGRVVVADCAGTGLEVAGIDRM
jgi:hypothetical protein